MSIEASRRGGDPYRTFRVRVEMDGRAVAGFSKISALKRGGGDSSRTPSNPGRTKYEPITLERGVTHDAEFEAWARLTWKGGGGIDPRKAVKKSRRDLVIEVLDEAGALTIQYQVFHCWVSEFRGLPDLDGHANAVAIEVMKIENEGWEREECAR